MSGPSILFDQPGQHSRLSARQPDSYHDLALDQVVAALAAGRQQYELEPLSTGCATSPICPALETVSGSSWACPQPQGLRSAAWAKPGYHRWKSAASSSLRTPVRICRRRWAPRGVQCINCFLHHAFADDRLGCGDGSGCRAFER